MEIKTIGQIKRHYEEMLIEDPVTEKDRMGLALQALRGETIKIISKIGIYGENVGIWIGLFEIQEKEINLRTDNNKEIMVNK